MEGRQQEKKKLLEAVKKHRKGMKSQLEDMLNNAKRLQRDEEVSVVVFIFVLERLCAIWND
ncbi:unnamed protein product [Anisakis simplex]|uniref:Uncharacterized protein n=1 Tax=Anisakis simplex TaxID=6269 RepID=A0A3P6PNB0_ANISI|nr:unnamed protein product [Anisakis simplex]